MMDLANTTVEQMEEQERQIEADALLNAQSLISDDLPARPELNGFGSTAPSTLPFSNLMESSRDQRVRELEAKVRDIESRERIREAFDQ